jgi:response regulator RpfG family c-di-GMP phosphodiesterase
MNIVLVATERDLEQNLLAQALDGQGYQIIRSRDGLDALEAARTRLPHLLLINVALPKLDGFALFRRFQQDEQLRRIPIVLFSTRSNDQKSERFAQELGAKSFVGNALKPGALKGVLEAALAAQPVAPLPPIEPPSKPIPALIANHQEVVVEPAPPARDVPTVQVAIDRTVKLPALTEPVESPQLQQLVAEQEQLREALQTVRLQMDGAQSWQSVFSLSPVAMWVVSKNSQKMLAVNDAALRLFAYSQTEFMQLDSPAVLREPGQANTTNVSGFRSKDGRVLSLLVNTRELSFKTQAAELWVAHDVGYRVRGERAMADEVQRVKALLANLPMAYWVINAEAQLCDVNAACCRLLGYTREQLLEQGLARLLNDQEQVSSLRTLQPGQTLSLPVLQGNGVRRAMEFSAGQAEFGNGLQVLALRPEPEPATVHMAVPQLASASKLPAVLEMLRYADDADENTLLQYAMAQLAHAFDSPLALFASLERVTQSLDLCATSHAQTKRRGVATSSITVPKPWLGLLTPRGVCSSAVPDEALLVNGLPEISSYVACSAAHGRELWLLVIANRDKPYSSVEQREVQECADILVALLGRMRQQLRLQSAAKRSAATTDNLVSLLETLLEHHDAYAVGSGQRVANLAINIARQMNLTPERQSSLALAARLHDIGHLMLPQSLLLSPASFSAAERALLQTHVEQGVRLLGSVDVGVGAAVILAQHHERLDGSGYPAELTGDQIMVEARILAVADVVEAMCAARAYRPASGLQAALDEVRAGAGRIYDAEVVSACERVFAVNEGQWPV